MTRPRLRAIAISGALAALAAACRGAPPPAGAPRTIALVTVDTLRRDRVGAYGGRVATPRIDALAARGTRFDDARTPVPLTLPSHVTMLTGLPPARHGVRSNSASRVPRAGPDRPFALVAERLAAAGRRCGAFVSAGPLASRYGLGQGFEPYDDGDLDDMTGLLPEERPGAETVEHALAWLRSIGPDAPAFLWVHLYEPHEPHPPAPSPSEAYDLDVRAADAALGALLDGLAAQGRGDAFVVLAADHGEALGEQGEASHGLLLGESVLRVPLVIAGPGVPAGAARADPVDLADVAPTILAKAGAPPLDLPDAPGVGRDLFAGVVPATRVRVAEGLHAHHQYRWAQLACAVRGDQKLEDRGAGRERVRRLRRDAPPWEDDVPAGTSLDLDLVAALRAYRNGERAARGPAESAAGGYGAGGPVEPFLDPAENARLLDPYEVISDATRIGQAASAVVRGAPSNPARVRAAIEELARIAARDPRNPSVPFWVGQLRREEGRFADAAESFRSALALGRTDPDTVLLLAGSLADARREAEALDALRGLLPSVAPDTRLFCLEARLLGALGRGVEARAAEEKARGAARTKRDRALLAKGCR